jgi:hypothetical protein
LNAQFAKVQFLSQKVDTQRRSARPGAKITTFPPFMGLVCDGEALLSRDALRRVYFVGTIAEMARYAASFVVFMVVQAFMARM